jgi:hypothetical protein
VALGGADAIGRRVGAAHDLGAPGERAIDLDLRRALGDDDQRGHAPGVRGGRHALGVVAARVRHHAAPAVSARIRARKWLAPRILNEPVRCRFSGFAKTRWPPGARHVERQERRVADVSADAVAGCFEVGEGGERHGAIQARGASRVTFGRFARTEAVRGRLARRRCIILTNVAYGV